jgi:hypothetical protein
VSEEEKIASRDENLVTPDKKAHIFKRLSAWATGHFVTNEPGNFPMSGVAKKGAFDVVVANTHIIKTKEDQAMLATMLRARNFEGKLIMVPKYDAGYRGMLPAHMMGLPVTNTSMSPEKGPGAECGSGKQAPAASKLLHVVDLLLPLEELTKQRKNDAHSNIFPVSADGKVCRERQNNATQCDHESHFCVPGPIDVVGDYILAAAVGA